MGNEGSKGLSKSDTAALAKQTNFDKNELAEMYKEFIAMDADKSGELDLAEFKILFKKRMPGASEDQLAALFASFDSDNSGAVSFKELSTSLSILSKGTVEEKLGYMFDMYDEDKSGELSGPEVDKITNQMRSVASALGRDPAGAQSFIDGVMKKLDKDGDKQITRAEWIEQGKSTPSLAMLLGI